jgi:hypothetical protein
MAYCVNCGAQLPSGAKFCAACGSLAGAGPNRPGRRRKTLRRAISATIALAVIVGALITIGLLAGSPHRLPFSEKFQGNCRWPQGSNAQRGESFAYGCRAGQYQLRPRIAGRYHVYVRLPFREPAVQYDIDVGYTPATPLPDTARPRPVVGLMCLSSSQQGYLAAVGDDGVGVIARLRGNDLAPETDLSRSDTPGPLGRVTRLTVVCVTRADGSTLVGMFVNGHLFHAYRDPAGYGPFDGVGVYTGAYPGVAAFDNLRAARPSTGVVGAIRAMLQT